jgi:hypothetical protein
MEVDREKAEQIAKKIIHQIAPLSEHRQRCFALSNKLSRFKEEMITEVFQVIAQGARNKEPDFQAGYRVISDTAMLSEYLGPRVLAGVYSIARSKNYQDVVRLMTRVPPWRVPGSGDDLEDKELREKTLGERKSLARTRDRDLINRLLNDQNPTVIYILLQNPILTVKEVIRIASKRPTSSQVLSQVYKNLKWINHYPIKKSLANNPYCPTQLALSLLHYLLEQDLEELADNEVLHPKIREAAWDLVLEKIKDRKPQDQE